MFQTVGFDSVKTVINGMLDFQPVTTVLISYHLHCTDSLKCCAKIHLKTSPLVNVLQGT